jgi:hypothetical protein
MNPGAWHWACGELSAAHLRLMAAKGVLRDLGEGLGDGRECSLESPVAEADWCGSWSL